MSPGASTSGTSPGVRRDDAESAPCSPTEIQSGSRRCAHGYEPASSWTERYLRGFGLDAIVQPLFEVAAQILAGRPECMARTARLESHNANLLVTRAVAARIALGFRQWTHTHAAHCRTTFGRSNGPRAGASVAFVA